MTSEDSRKEMLEAQVFFSGVEKLIEEDVIKRGSSFNHTLLKEDSDDLIRDSWVTALTELRKSEGSLLSDNMSPRPSSIGKSTLDMSRPGSTACAEGESSSVDVDNDFTEKTEKMMNEELNETVLAQKNTIDDSSDIGLIEDTDTIILDMFGIEELSNDNSMNMVTPSTPSSVGSSGGDSTKAKRGGLFRNRRTMRFSAAKVGAHFFRDRFSSKARSKKSNKDNVDLSGYDSIAPAVVTNTGDQTPTAVFVVQSNTTETVCGTSSSSRASTPQTETKDKEDLQIDEKVYGAAVTLLISGMSKRELPDALEKQGWRPDVIQRVTKDFARLIPGSPPADTENTKTVKAQEKKSAQEPVSERAAPFCKMLKMGVPPAAVELKMKAQGLSRQEMRAVLTAVAGENDDTSNDKPPANENQETRPNKPSDDPILAPYARMLKLGVAMDNVLLRMRLDEVNADAVRRFRIAYNLEPEEIVADISPRAEENDSTERPSVMGLHWEKIECDTEVRNSVWANNNHELDKEDMEHLKELFAAAPSTTEFRSENKKSTPSLKRAASMGTPSPRLKSVELLDKKRFQNMTIALSKFARQFRHDFEALWLAVEEMSSELDTEALDRLRETLPTSEETNKVITYVQEAGEKRSDQLLAEKRLGLAEKFVLATSRVPEHMLYLNAATELRSFGARADAINQAAECVSLAATQIVSSKGLALTLQRILAVGNVMNAGTRRGQAQGVRLGSLLTIIKTKGRDRKTTVLDYVINGLLKRGHTEALEEVATTLIEPVANAVKLSVAEIERDMAALERGLQYIIKIEQSKREDTKNILFAVAKAEGDAMSRHDARSFCFLPANYKRPEFPCSTARAAALGRRATRLELFLNDAHNTVAWLRENRTALMKEHAQALCEFFGEDVSTYQNAGRIFDTAHSFLQAFTTSYKATIQKSLTEKKLEERRQRSAKMLEKRITTRDQTDRKKISTNSNTRVSVSNNLRPTRERPSTTEIQGNGYTTVDDTVLSTRRHNPVESTATSSTGRDLLLKAKSKQSRVQLQKESTSRRSKSSASSKHQAISRSSPPIPDAWSALTEVSPSPPIAARSQESPPAPSEQPAAIIPDVWASVLPS
eukprot:CAMPEP_0197321270 /NCGR_PEP_ID=MMETSP0891-20130614/64132_1 /TAXON_ID=44058 ORGANISM="Aureoumbra lagunensis, Strain CCMP1510" /NCGR_SAMPLE_ID=MMETSP0891 /ASSEMBLY_ACC=CAM_ASM_000534 /LENGTH=1108 /DNA_ID=CAMNT_0042813059 /DNA_START=111 /DNA_END=3440 /DNA_ORIENTATION=-